MLTKEEQSKIDAVKKELAESVDEAKASLFSLVDSFGPQIVRYETAIKKIWNSKNHDEAVRIAADILNGK